MGVVLLFVLESNAFIENYYWKSNQSLLSPEFCDFGILQVVKNKM